MTRIELIFRPLEGWPRELTTDAARKQRPFQVKRLDMNLAMLKSELIALGCKSAILQTAFADEQLSALTGQPLPDRKPAHPGVIVAADTRHGALKWVCDDCAKWHDNVRAIAMTLERLRLADRYGVTRKGEQYLGWKMLPGPITASDAQANGGMSIDEAARFVGSIVGVDARKILDSRGWWETAYKDAAKRLHPDKANDAGKWKTLQDAARLLNGLHNR